MRFDEEYYGNITVDYLNSLTGFAPEKGEMLDKLKYAISQKSYYALTDKARAFFVALIDDIEGTIDNAELYRCHKACKINNDYDTRTNSKIERIYTGGQSSGYSKDDYKSKVNFAKEMIKSSVTIEDILEKYYFTGAEKRHKNMCLCPFHNEKTPSFSFNNAKDNFRCFGCGESGDSISFVEKYFNLKYTEAVKKIDEDFGLNNLDVTLNDDVKNRVATAENQRQKVVSEREKRQKEKDWVLDEIAKCEKIGATKVDENTSDEIKEQIVIAHGRLAELNRKLEEFENEEYLQNHGEQYAQYLENEGDKEGAEQIRKEYVKPKKQEVKAELTAKLDIKLTACRQGSQALAMATIKVNDRFSFPVWIMQKHDKSGNYLLYPNFKTSKGEYSSYIQPTNKQASELISNCVLGCLNEDNSIKFNSLTVGEKQTYSTVKVVRITPLAKDNQLNHGIATVCVDNLININAINVKQYPAKDNQFVNYVDMPQFIQKAHDVVTFDDVAMLNDLKTKCVKEFSKMRVNYYTAKKSKGMSL